MLKEMQSASWLGNPLSSVATAVVHALFGKYPRPRYLVGMDAKVQAILYIYTLFIRTF